MFQLFLYFAILLIEGGTPDFKLYFSIPETGTQIRLSNTKYLLPSISSVINTADSEERKSFVIYSSVKEETTDGFSDSIDPDKEDVLDMDLDSSSNPKEDIVKPAPNR